jgi:ribonucleoside-triphosphate reductase
MNPAWGPLGQDVYERTYSRRKPDGSMETWFDTVERVVAGNIALVPSEHIENDEAEKLLELIKSFALLPAGRHLWVGGVEGRTFSFNCHHSGWGERLSDHVGFLMDCLMTGGGSGSNYSNSVISRLPHPMGEVETLFVVHQHEDQAEFAHQLSSPSSSGEVFQVDDSREGWVAALCRLTDLAEDGGGTLVFDVTDVRPRGSIIKGFGGTASGPAPLINMLDGVSNILNKQVGTPWTSLALMEIDHAIASCVIAGNVRRSARMSIKNWADDDIYDFITCKANQAEHWSTNISVEIDDDFHWKLAGGLTQEEHSHALDVFDCVVEGMIANGEPGFWNKTLASVGETAELCPNPCGEIGLEQWEPCCLGHINLAYFGEDLSRAAEASRLMARFLLRATFADTADPRQREVVDRNRRIGVGLLGYQEWGASHGLTYSQIPQSEIMAVKLELLSTEAKMAAKLYARELGIPSPIKTTCVAPTGSVSMLPGVTAGIHPIYARYMKRRVRYASDDPALERHIAEGRHVEDCIYTENTKVVTFVARDKILDDYDEDLIEQADEISVLDMLRTQAFIQENWADNAVSFTVNIPEGIPHYEISTSLIALLERLKGTTIMTDGSREQAPLERIDRATYEELSIGDVSQGIDECSTGACPVR